MKRSLNTALRERLVQGAGLISVTELALHVEAVRGAVRLSVVAAADTGFGNALNVQRTVRTLESAGACQAAGADMLRVEAPLNREEPLAIPGEVPGLHPCDMVFGGRTPWLSRGELAGAGHAAIRNADAAPQAMVDAPSFSALERRYA